MDIVVIEAVDDDGLNETEITVIREFKVYKQDSLAQTPSNFANPNEQTHQRTTESPHALFGRDRIFDFPTDMINEIFGENLAHIHIDTDGEWEGPTFQWFATSKNALIYSAFEHGESKVFVVHDILMDFEPHDDKGAHKYYDTEDIEKWLELATWHRKNYRHDYQRIID